MKKLLLISFVIVSLKCYSQAKFTGIGIFKIGTDTSVIQKYSKSMNIELTNIGSPSVYFDLYNSNNSNSDLLQDSKPGIYKIEWNAGNVNRHIASLCEDVQSFFINEYEVSGIKLYNVNLKFYKNKLVKVSCKLSDDIVAAMTQKYGTPKIKLKKKIINCVYKLTGIKEPHPEFDKSQTWNNGLITAIAFVSTFYYTDCTSSKIDGFSYEIKNLMLENCEKPIDEKPKARSLKEF